MKPLCFPGIQRARGLPILQRTGAAGGLPDVRLQPGHVVPGLHARLHDLQKGAVLPRPRQLRPAGQNCKGAGD